MKPYFKFTFAILSIVILFSSCGKSNDKGKMIPASAVVVAQVNLRSLGDHLSWNDIKQTAWYQKAFSNTATPEWRKKILENPAASGIDFDKGLVFFAVKGSGNDFMIVAEGDTKSEKDFEQFNKNFDPAQTIRKAGSIKLLTLKDKNVVGWNGTHFAYVMNSRTTASVSYTHLTLPTNREV